MGDTWVGFYRKERMGLPQYGDATNNPEERR